MRRTAVAWVLPVVLLGACSRPADTPPIAAPTTAARAEAVDWRRAAGEADVDAAFAQARAAGRPVFLYWGASWCPPCNQLLATVFNRQDFIARSRAFVAVYVDGDKPGAQKLGERFGVRAYPTMVLFDRDGRELTRLPGEVDPAQVNEVLGLGLSARRPAAEVLAAARTGGVGLGADDWQLLAFYSWETAATGTRALLTEAERPAVLRRLAQACPPEQTAARTRLLLKALAFAGEPADALPDVAARGDLERLLADAAQARAYVDVLINSAPELVRAVADRASAQRPPLLRAFDAALRRFEVDATLSRADRLGATIARVALARIDLPAQARDPQLPAPLLADARAAAARVDRESTERYEREALIPTAAYLLAQAGLIGESDQLLQANLERSGSPYYLMTSLAANARRRGDVAAALSWSEQAYAKSVGPATRLQWGASYITTLVDLAPQDAARIERAAAQLIDEAAAAPDGFHERSARSMQRAGAKLVGWNREPAQAAVLGRLKARLDAVCARLPQAGPSRAACERVFLAPA